MKIKAIPRITSGLVALALAVLLVFDLTVGIFPNEAETTQQIRKRVTNNLAIQVAALAQAQDLRAVDRTLRALQSRDPDLLSIGLRRDDGSLLAQAGDHARQWQQGGGPKDSIAIQADGRRWGTVEVVFRRSSLTDVSSWHLPATFRFIVLFTLIGSTLFYLYLRRVLQHLDPSAAVPERVRAAFDALSEGVLIVDGNGRVLLANQGFQAFNPDAGGVDLIGKRASDLTWLTPAVSAAGAFDDETTPWLTAIATRTPVKGRTFDVTSGGAVSAKVVVDCSPVQDDRGEVRGCIVTFGDVTALEKSHQQLLAVLADLAYSKGQLEHKNAELEQLASHDSLSACLNRRALFERAEPAFREAAQRERRLACIMVDIDFFKAINDRHGHATGDRAIQRVGELLRQSMRPTDLVGRYGGEEFCVIVREVSGERAVQMAEAIRERLADDRGVELPDGQALSMTASFGVSLLEAGATTLSELIDQADRAMYRAKQSGRNRVVEFEQAARPAAVQPLEFAT